MANILIEIKEFLSTLNKSSSSGSRSKVFPVCIMLHRILLKVTVCAIDRLSNLLVR